MKLFMVHLGFYDDDLGEGIYESHINHFIGATSAQSAKKKISALPEFKQRKMHIDGIKELSHVEGYKITLEKTDQFNKSKVYSYNDSKKL